MGAAPLPVPHLPTPFPAADHGDSRGARSSVPAELSMCLTAPGKPGPAYLEDRGQVLSHFQCLSLHCVNHILHPGAGVAAGPATVWEGQTGQGPGVRKCPRYCRLASAPEGTGRDGTDGARGRGGWRRARGLGARSSRPRRRAADRAQLSPGRKAGRPGRGGVLGGKSRRTRTPALWNCLLPFASLAPLPASPSLTLSP